MKYIQNVLSEDLNKLWEQCQDVYLFYISIEKYLYKIHTDWFFNITKQSVVNITFKYLDLNINYKIPINVDLMTYLK